MGAGNSLIFLSTTSIVLVVHSEQEIFLLCVICRMRESLFTHTNLVVTPCLHSEGNKRWNILVVLTDEIFFG